MGKMYRITVAEIDEANEEIGIVLGLSAAAEMLRQFAPSAVAAALGVTPVTDEQLDEARAGLERIGVLSEQPKRRRRTKAEMEAVRAAEEVDIPEPAPMAMDGPAEPAKAYSPFG